MLQRRQWNSTPVLLPRKSHGRKSLVCCSPWGRYSRTRLSDFTFAFHFHALEKEMATHSSVLAWRIPGTGKPGGLPSVGSHRVGHDWSDLAAAAAWRDASGKILSEVGKNTSAKPSIKWPLNWAAVAGLGIQMCIWARLAGPGMNPWLQLLPELQGMGYPPNLVWWRPPMRPARRNFVIASVWAREITPRIRAWHQLLTAPPSLLSSSAQEKHPYQFSPVSVTLPGILQHLAHKYHSFQCACCLSDTWSHGQLPLPLLTFISTSNQPCATNNRIKCCPEFPWYRPKLNSLHLSSLILLPLKHKNYFSCIFIF